MKVEETLFEKHFRVIFENICGLLQNPDDQELKKTIQENIKLIVEKYNNNSLVELLKKKLFDLGMYHHQEFSSKLFLLKKRQVEKLVEPFKNDGSSGIISILVSQLFIQLDGKEFGELLRNVCKKFKNTTVYDGNTEKIINKIRKEVPLEIYEDDDNEHVMFSKVIQRRKLETNSIIIDCASEVVYWSKQSFETFVQQVKQYQKMESLSTMIELIGKVRQVQTKQIIESNSIAQSDLLMLPLHLRKQVEKLKQENESARNLFSQGFNTNSFHFILEFIQNADDGEYFGDGILEFDFDQTNKLLRINSNESGFTFDNLYALSGIADSDKVSKKLEAPAIGEKGIGFKTVFSVCDQVHLVSNGFDVNLTSLDLKENLEVKEFNLTYGTSFEISIDEFEHTLFEKHTLLTLKNLKTIIFKDNKKTTTYSITIDENNECTLTTTVKTDMKTSTDTEKFYCFKSKIDMKHILCEKRPNFHEAILLIFYPKVWNNKRFKLHSFLPVKEDYNLPLLIQSDFLLSQNREALIDDSNWNIRIINKIPKLIVESFESMKNINGWKYDFFKMLDIESKLHFQGIQHKIIEMLNNVKCIPVKGIQEDMFEKPSDVLLMSSSPINPYEVFGIRECTQILSKHCVDSIFEQNNLMKSMNGMVKMNGSHIELLAKELPYLIKLDKSVLLFKLFKQFSIDVHKFNFEIIPTALEKLVKPSVSFLDGLSFSKGALLILENAGCHFISSQIDFYKQNIRISGKPVSLSNEHKFVLLAEESAAFSEKLCLTTDGKWTNPQECYFESIHTQYLKNPKFVDTNKLLALLTENRSKVSSQNQLQAALSKLGVKSVPTLFKNRYSVGETEDLVLLRQKYPKLEELIGYFDSYASLFQDQIGGIKQFLNRNIQDLYDPKLRREFGDSIDYLPTISSELLKTGINAKQVDFDAYQKLVLKSKNASSIVKALTSTYSLKIKQLLHKAPLLQTNEGLYVVLSPNLFTSLDRRVQKYKPEWKEIGGSYKLKDITSLLRSHSISDYYTVLKECNPSMEDQQYFIETIFNLQRSLSTYGIYITINGNKKLLSDMFWDLHLKEVFPVSVNDKLLAPHFPTSNQIKKALEASNNITKFPELCHLLKNHLENILASDISKLDKKEVVQLEALIVSGFNFHISDKLVWDLHELKDIPFFHSLDLSFKFGNSSATVRKYDNTKARLVSESKIVEFLSAKDVSDEDFHNVCTYLKRTPFLQKLFTFIRSNGLIVHHNEKRMFIDLFRAGSTVILENFPHLKSLQVDHLYKEFEIPKEIPVHIICKEIENLEGCTENAEEKCLIMYKEIDRQIKDGIIKKKDVDDYKRTKIFRNDKGRHFSGKIYFCDNEETYKHLSSVVDCLFVRDLSISHFLEAFNIRPLSEKLSLNHLKIELSQLTYEKLVVKTESMIKMINNYLVTRKLVIEPKTIALQVVKSIKVMATIVDGPSCEINPEVHSDIEKGIIYINDNVVDSIFKDKRLVVAFLQFYPHLERCTKDMLTLCIPLYGETAESVETYMSWL